MKKISTYLGMIVLLTVVFISCDSQPSLQKYYVDSKENATFISLDIPASILQLSNKEASKEIKETLSSIKKLNFLGFQLTDSNNEEFIIEKNKIKEILNNPKYQDLIAIGGKQSLSVKYLGDDDAIDEVIIYGSDKEKGFALVRILGKNMDPSKMMALAQEINIDENEGSMKMIESFIKNIK